MQYESISQSLIFSHFKRGLNGIKSTDFNVSRNRTHKKSENAAIDKENNTISETP